MTLLECLVEHLKTEEFLDQHFYLFHTFYLNFSNFELPQTFISKIAEQGKDC